MLTKFLRDLDRIAFRNFEFIQFDVTQFDITQFDVIQFRVHSIWFLRYWSQFLSHVYRELDSRNPKEFSFIMDYLNQSQSQLRDQLPSTTEGNSIFSISSRFFVSSNPSDT